MDKQPQTDDKAWLELQAMSAIYSLREIAPNHPLVTAVRMMLDLAHEAGQYEQLELDLVGAPLCIHCGKPYDPKAIEGCPRCLV